MHELAVLKAELAVLKHELAVLIEGLAGSNEAGASRPALIAIAALPIFDPQNADESRLIRCLTEALSPIEIEKPWWQ